MKIGIVLPIYLKRKKKNECYAKVIRNYAKMGVLVHICGSEGNISYNFAKPFLSDNVKYFEVPQEAFCTISSGDDHIRKKFNDSLHTLPDNLDWYCLGGADDLVNPNFFNGLLQLDSSKKLMVGVGMDNPLYLLDENDNWKAYSIKLSYSNKFTLLAGINCFSKAYFKSIDNPYALSGCETGAETLALESGEVIGLDGSIIMYKGRDVLNPLSKCLRKHEIVKISKEELDYIETTLI